MKITDIQIERYGVWNHLALPLQSAGLNVFYGPNEAGKTTLLRFIRDVLYGSQSLEGNPADTGNPLWNGALRIAQADRFCEVRRWCDRESSQGVEFQELDPCLAWTAEPDWGITESADFDSSLKVGEPAEQALHEILAETHARLFRHVFAIGLNELQELSTLQEEEVAEQIYSLSLGLEGRKLLAVSSQIGPARECPQASENWERLSRLMNRDAELKRELEQLAGQRERFEQLVNQEARLESEIQDLKAKQAEQQQQLLGHETVQRVWEPWNQVREYEAELRLLPQGTVPAGMDASRLTALENEIRERIRERKVVIAEIRRLQKSLREMSKDTTKKRHAADLQSFLKERAWVVQVERELELASTRARELQTEFEARQKVLGPEWPVQRLASIDTSHAAYTRLVDAARGFQSVQARLSSLRKRYDKYAANCQQQQAEWDQQIEALPEQSLDGATLATRQQLAQVEELARLTLKESELEQRLASQKRERTRLQERSRIPHWVPGFLLFLAMSGLVLSGLGFYTSLTSNGIAGLILGLVGIAGFAISRAFQLESGDLSDEELSEVESAIQQGEQTLQDVRDAIQEHTPEAWAVAVSEEELAEDRPEIVITAKLSDRLSDLKQIETLQRRLKSRRRKLSRMRKALQARQRDVGQARQDWCAALKKCGLEETVHIGEAFELWQKIAETMEHRRAWDAALETVREVQKQHEQFCRRLAEHGERTGQTSLDYNHPLRVLDLWQKESAHAGEDRHELQTARRELKEQKREANRLKQKILSAKSARRALLVQVGATSREEFEQRLDAAGRRQELEELLQIAKAELAAINEASSDLAIVEEDLQRYNSRETQEFIDLLMMELDDLESRLGEAFQNLAEVQQELKAIETDRRPAAIRFERESITGQLRECLAQMAALRLGAKAVDQIREDFEQTCQPQILEIASEYLAQLTCGKYLKIWTTLDEKRLLLMDAEENSVSVEQLSNGTREQLFLALRLALVSEYAQRGIELPMVLDDVLVNFDQYRTEAAIQTLIEFAERGHQVLLFTSHLHLARLCESQGIDPVWLPAHHAVVEHRRAG